MFWGMWKHTGGHGLGFNSVGAIHGELDVAVGLDGPCSFDLSESYSDPDAMSNVKQGKKMLTCNCTAPMSSHAHYNDIVGTVRHRK